MKNRANRYIQTMKLLRIGGAIELYCIWEQIKLRENQLFQEKTNNQRKIIAAMGNSIAKNNLFTENDFSYDHDNLANEAIEYKDQFELLKENALEAFNLNQKTIDIFCSEISNGRIKDLMSYSLVINTINKIILNYLCTRKDEWLCNVQIEYILKEIVKYPYYSYFIHNPILKIRNIYRDVYNLINIIDDKEETVKKDQIPNELRLLISEIIDKIDKNPSIEKKYRMGQISVKTLFMQLEVNYQKWEKELLAFDLIDQYGKPTEKGLSTGIFTGKIEM